jgi:hypothetical protein
MFAVEAVLDSSSLAAASFGVGIDARFVWSLLEVGVQAVWLPPVRQGVTARESVQFELMTVGPRLCYRALERPLVANVCAGGGIGRFSADGSGLARNRERFDELWIAPAAGIELRRDILEGVAVRVGTDVLRPLIRERYTVNGEDIVYSPAEAVFRVQAGVAVSAP